MILFYEPILVKRLNGEYDEERRKLFDLDVFVYRHFATYIPKNCTFITGGGGYGTDFNRRKLKRIARDMEFAHVGLSGMGSTWSVIIFLSSPLSNNSFSQVWFST